MASPALRFIHASDFHLERPMRGLSEIPSGLAELIADAPQRAVERVFDAAISEHVDFVLLAGDILQPTAAGPRSLVLLVEQLERLHARGIPVYWTTGRVDAATRWTDILHLPPNVHLATGRRVEHWKFERDGRLPAEILAGTADEQHLVQPTNFRPTAGSMAIALAHGRLATPAVAAQGVHYWALGGRHRRRVERSEAPVVHYPGTPQGRSPSEAGPHGCTLVQVDDAHMLRTRFLPTDSLRWHTETIRLDAHMGRADLERQIDHRSQVLLATAGEPQWLVRWRVHAPPALAVRLRRDPAVAQLVSHLRGKFGHRQGGIYSLAIDVEPPARLPEQWWQEETIRGEFLRAMHSRLADGRGAEDWRHLLPSRPLPDGLAAALALDDVATRERVLAQATLLGVDLLSGEEPQA
ncbi:MAG TPA: DNA repair exonuclease [Pirellulales bacterium]|jgi:predicted phosphodiesterase|nr:DNA repair exonuclease [Pirellulales bacterium]